MKTLKLLFAAILFVIPALSFAAPVPKGFSKIGTKAIQEDDVKFTYMSNDGEIRLSCAHVYDRPDAWDWDVWCGKGTNMLRIFRVHFLAQQFYSSKADKSAIEILYWVTDRDQVPTKMFSSTTTWLQFKGKVLPEKLEFSQGVENDYAYLTLEFTPH